MILIIRIQTGDLKVTSTLGGGIIADIKSIYANATGNDRGSLWACLLDYVKQIVLKWRQVILEIRRLESYASSTARIAAAISD